MAALCRKYYFNANQKMHNQMLIRLSCDCDPMTFSLFCSFWFHYPETLGHTAIIFKQLHCKD